MSWKIVFLQADCLILGLIAELELDPIEEFVKLASVDRAGVSSAIFETVHAISTLF